MRYEAGAARSTELARPGNPGTFVSIGPTGSAKPIAGRAPKPDSAVLAAVAAIADGLADRFAQRVMPSIADLVDDAVMRGLAATAFTGERRGKARQDDGRTESLWTAQQVAARYRVEVGFVYQQRR